MKEQTLYLPCRKITINGTTIRIVEESNHFEICEIINEINYPIAMRIKNRTFDLIDDAAKKRFDDFPAELKEAINRYTQ